MNINGYLTDLKKQQEALAVQLTSKNVEASSSELLNDLIPKVENVYHSGQLNVIENTSTLKKSVSGSAIFIDDVSPVTHEMFVKISAIPKKNLLNRLIAKVYRSDVMNVPTEDFINTYCSKKISFKQGNTYTFSIKDVSEFSDSAAWALEFYIFDNGLLFVSDASDPPVTFSTDFFTSDSSANEYTCYNGSALWTKSNIVTNQGPWSMTITPVKDFEAVFIVTEGNVIDNTVVTEAQIEEGSTATDYVPYIENPVTDLTTVKVTRRGKNLFSGLTKGIGINSVNGSEIVSSNYSATDYIPVDFNTNTNYYISGLPTTISNYVAAYNANKEFLGRTGGSASSRYKMTSAASFQSGTPQGEGNIAYLRVSCFKISTSTGTIDDIDDCNIQLEVGSADTEYEPYNSATFTPTADGIVEGVTSLYPNTALLTDTDGAIIDCDYYKDIDVDEVVTKTITMYTNPKIKTVGKYAFYSCSALKIIDIPIATNIGNNAFQDCTSLTTVNLPIVTNIEMSAFYGCSVLKTLYAPAVIKISSRAFEYCTSLTTANFPVVTNIEMYAFQNCTSLITANFPLLTSINGYAFTSCTSLTTINFPVATTIVSYAFSRCSTLKTVNFPAVTAIETYAFQYCTALTTVDFPILTKIGANVFKSCATLTSVILRNNTICTLSNTNAFTGCTLITGTGGYIYVPASLIDEYKTATNWVTFADKFRALEDYTIDGTTTGALDESKVSA